MTSALAHLETVRFPREGGEASFLRMHCLLPGCSWRAHINRADYVGVADNATLLAMTKATATAASSAPPPRRTVKPARIERNEDQMREAAIREVAVHLRFVHGIHGAIAIAAEAFVLTAEGAEGAEEKRREGTRATTK